MLTRDIYAADAVIVRILR